jgi:hypothetical protein
MKPIIKKLKFSKEEEEEINLINKGQTVPTVRTVINKKTGVKQDIVYHKRFTYEMGIKRLRELYGGLCRCGAWPAYKIMFQVGDKKQGAWLVERYCQKCYDKQEKYLKK